VHRDKSKLVTHITICDMCDTTLTPAGGFWWNPSF